MLQVKLRRWSKGAIECYKRGCICAGCPISALLETECLMKFTVINLVKRLGLPKILKNSFLTVEENQKK